MGLSERTRVGVTAPAMLQEGRPSWQLVGFGYGVWRFMVGFLKILGVEVRIAVRVG